MYLFIPKTNRERILTSSQETVLSCHWEEPVDACCSPKYGLVVLALQWIPGFGPPDEFTIHGLWPDTCSGGRAPSRGCDRTRSSNNVGNIIKNANANLYRRLRELWPSYKGDNNWFWSHEWTKHGTCVSTLRPTCYGDSYRKYQDVEEYFEQVLDLHYQYDIYGVLNVGGVSPGRIYSANTIHDTLEQFYKAKVMLTCDRQGQLREVSLYFYVKGRNGYQITNALSRGNCRGPVWFPRKDSLSPPR
ncbi:ribonuclease T2-like protein [Dichotomocladium elegans]|nr:ribonuclease T2-like protein [Dichotomocladium elegans]